MSLYRSLCGRENIVQSSKPSKDSSHKNIVRVHPTAKKSGGVPLEIRLPAAQSRHDPSHPSPPIFPKAVPKPSSPCINKVISNESIYKPKKKFAFGGMVNFCSGVLPIILNRLGPFRQIRPLPPHRHAGGNALLWDF